MFDAVRAKFPHSPAVVTYNAGPLVALSSQGSIFWVPIESVLFNLKVNTFSSYATAPQAVIRWDVA